MKLNEIVNLHKQIIVTTCRWCNEMPFESQVCSYCRSFLCFQCIEIIRNNFEFCPYCHSSLQFEKPSSEILQTINCIREKNFRANFKGNYKEYATSIQEKDMNNPFLLTEKVKKDCIFQEELGNLKTLKKDEDGKKKVKVKIFKTKKKMRSKENRIILPNPESNALILKSIDSENENMKKENVCQNIIAMLSDQSILKYSKMLTENEKISLNADLHSSPLIQNNSSINNSGKIFKFESYFKQKLFFNSKEDQIQVNNKIESSSNVKQTEARKERRCNNLRKENSVSHESVPKNYKSLPIYISNIKKKSYTMGIVFFEKIPKEKIFVLLKIVSYKLNINDFKTEYLGTYHSKNALYKVIFLNKEFSLDLAKFYSKMAQYPNFISIVPNFYCLQSIKFLKFELLDYEDYKKFYHSTIN